MIIRDATAQDLPGILAIYNDVIATSTAVYALEPVSLADRARWRRHARRRAFPSFSSRRWR